MTVEEASALIAERAKKLLFHANGKPKGEAIFCAYSPCNRFCDGLPQRSKSNPAWDNHFSSGTANPGSTTKG